VGDVPESDIRFVGARQTYRVDQQATIVVQVRPALGPYCRLVTEELSATSDGVAIEPMAGFASDYRSWMQEYVVPPGTFTLNYEAEVDVDRQPRAPLGDHDSADNALERMVMLRPSRYVPSDHTVGLANAEFGGLATDAERVRAIESWINRRIGYVPGTSNVHDTAEDTLLTGMGICRDFAHLGILLCRSLNIPARFAAVYAPGLNPMDFHAVFEAWHDGAWWAYDATRLVPRQTLVRIATGRDASDTPFASVLSGAATLIDLVVSSWTPDPLPADDHASSVAIA
jgi:transglutaminase-like putative cysteine protease